MGWGAKTDPLTNGVRLVVAISGFAAKPSLMEGLKTGLSVHDTLRKMLAEAPPGIKTLADSLTEEAGAVFNGFSRDLPGDAAVLYEQMVIASLPDASAIVDADMDAGAITEAMVAKLTDREHTRPPMPDLFRDLTRPVLERLLTEKSFTEDLMSMWMAAILQDLGNIAEKLDSLATASRDLMEALATRFQIPDAFDLSDAALRGELEKKAQDYRALKREVDAIDPAMKRLANLKAAAQEAIARVDLEEVERLLLLVQTSELEEAAKTAELRADNALLRGRVEDAYRMLSAAADSFAGVDPLEPALRRNGYAILLASHGERYGGLGLTMAAEMFHAALTVLTREAHPTDWAMAQQNLGVALETQGSRTAGSEGAALLADAARAYRAALSVRTRADHSSDWATTQQNLAGALLAQGSRAVWPEDEEFLAEAVEAYRAALTVRTREEHPMEWAKIQQNLGVALKTQGSRTTEPEGSDLLAEAVEAYRAAHIVFTRKEHPVEWAKIQQNLGVLLKTQARRAAGEKGAGLFTEAVAAYRAALTVRTREDHPVDWTETTANIAMAEEAWADHGSTEDAVPHLLSALDHAKAALALVDPKTMSHHYAIILDLRDRLRARLAALGES